MRIAAAPWLAHEEIQQSSGRLVEVMPEARPQSMTLGVLYPTRRMLPPRAKSFIDLAVEELRRHLGEQLALLGPA
ncbi:MAG: hypothetical protein ACLPSW_22205 [Roseiarcus sp.]